MQKNNNNYINKGSPTAEKFFNMNMNEGNKD